MHCGLEMDPLFRMRSPLSSTRADSYLQERSALAEFPFAALPELSGLLKWLDRIPEAAFITDKGGRILHRNSVAAALQSDAAGGSIARFLASRLPDWSPRAALRVFEDSPAPRAWSGELLLQRAEDEPLPVRVIVAPLEDADSSPETGAFLWQCVDLAFQPAMRAQLAEAERIASIGLLAGALAHEIGTPMGIVRGRSELMLMRYSHDPELQRSLGVIIKQIDRVSRVMRSVLNITRPVPNLKQRPLSLLTQINDAFTRFENRIRTAGIEWRCQVPEDCRVSADPEMLQQAFENLLTNAIHAIEAEEPNAKPRLISFVASGTEAGNVQARLSDTGCGIAPENLEKIWAPFFSTKASDSGSGLGLVIVQRRLAEIGGSVRCSSEAGVGTSFDITLRAALPSAGACELSN